MASPIWVPYTLNEAQTHWVARGRTPILAQPGNPDPLPPHPFLLNDPNSVLDSPAAVLV